MTEPHEGDSPGPLDHLARNLTEEAMTAADWAAMHPGEPVSRHRLLRDELTGADRAVSNALDDWLWRLHGTASSSSGWDLFVDLLAEEGYVVVPIEAGDA